MDPVLDRAFDQPIVDCGHYFLAHPSCSPIIVEQSVGVGRLREKKIGVGRHGVIILHVMMLVLGPRW